MNESTDDTVPRIHVRAIGDADGYTFHVEYGIEEEGVPWVVETTGSTKDPVEVAHEVSCVSKLKIGVTTTPAGRVVLHQARLPVAWARRCV